MQRYVMPIVDEGLCNLCGVCVDACPSGAVHLLGGRLLIDRDLCAYCGDCEDVCPRGAVALPFEIVLMPPESGGPDDGS